MAEREIREGALIAPGSRVVVAVSGGPDSMALFHVLYSLQRAFDFELIAHAVHHGIREDAEAEIELVSGFASRLGAVFEVTRLRVEAGGNLQARARAARLGALRQATHRHGASCIALGHHADDRAETLLLRILRGCGPAGLAVMPAHAGDLIRPLIRARRSDVLRHLQRHGVPYAVDPSNEDRRFDRVRVRSELLPMLESMSPKVVQHLCELAEDMVALDLPAVGMGRDQLRQLARAAHRRNAEARVSLPAGRVARVDVSTGRIVVETPEDTKGARKPRQSRDGA